jgi:hypothetical protein
MELDIRAEYCARSEENAKQYLDDMARDIREVIETHLGQMNSMAPRVGPRWQSVDGRRVR